MADPFHETRTALDHCQNCGNPLNEAMAAGHGGSPGPGDISICGYCGHVMAFDDSLKRRNLTDEEVVEIAGDPELVRAVNAVAEANRRHQA